MNEREDREEKQELGQNPQGQLNLEDLERKLSAQETEEDGQRQVQGGHSPESKDRVQRVGQPSRLRAEQK